MTLVVDNISYAYPGENRFELQHVDLTIAKGEVIALAGKSGSGKTTLLKLLAGLFSPTSGSVVLDGEKMKDPASKLIRGYPGFTIVHQDFELFPRYTVAQNILHPLRRLPNDEKQDKLSELLMACDIEDIKDARVIDISGGQKQRTAIATALAGEPDVLLMDEPFSHLDQVNKSKLSRSLKRYIMNRQVTTILSSHEPTDLLGIADKVILLKDGVLSAEGTPTNLYKHPINEDTARLFGEVNIVEFKDFDHYGFNKAEGNKALIRPADVVIKSEKSSDDMDATIEEVIFAGWYSQLVIKNGNCSFTAYVSNDTKYEVNAKIAFSINMNNVSYIS